VVLVLVQGGRQAAALTRVLLSCAWSTLGPGPRRRRWIQHRSLLTRHSLQTLLALVSAVRVLLGALAESVSDHSLLALGACVRTSNAGSLGKLAVVACYCDVTGKHTGGSGRRAPTSNTRVGSTFLSSFSIQPLDRTATLRLRVDSGDPPTRPTCSHFSLLVWFTRKETQAGLEIL
jgi:hypothetical protein